MSRWGMALIFVLVSVAIGVAISECENCYVRLFLTGRCSNCPTPPACLLGGKYGRGVRYECPPKSPQTSIVTPVPRSATKA